MTHEKFNVHRTIFKPGGYVHGAYEVGYRVLKKNARLKFDDQGREVIVLTQTYSQRRCSEGVQD